MLLAVLILSAVNTAVLLVAGVKGFMVYRSWSRRRQNAKSSFAALATLAAKRKQTKGA